MFSSYKNNFALKAGYGKIDDCLEVNFQSRFYCVYFLVFYFLPYLVLQSDYAVTRQIHTHFHDYLREPPPLCEFPVFCFVFLEMTKRF